MSDTPVVACARWRRSSAARAFRNCLSLCISAALGACALLPPRVPASPPLLAPSALGAAHSASQTLNVAYADQDLNLQAALQTDAKTTTLIALGPLGSRALTIRYDGAQLSADASPYVPAAFPPAQILSDLQLVLWPSAAWQAKLAGSDWEFSEPRPGLRRLRHGGRLVAEVHYADSSADPWQGRAWLSNLAYGYTLDVTTQPQ